MEASEKPNDVQLGDLVVFMVAKTHGTTPVAHGVKRVYYDVTNVRSEPVYNREPVYEQEAEAEVEQSSSSVAKIHRGLVRNQSKKDPSKYFIECSELAGQYDSDVKLLSMEKPDNVDVGDTVEFVIMEVDVGAPLAVCVTRVPVARQQMPGSLVQAASNAMASAPRVIGAPPTPAAKRPRLDGPRAAVAQSPTSRLAGPRLVPAIFPAIRAS